MSVEAIAKSGYEFEGWYHEDVKLEGNATSVTLPAEINTCNFEIVAKWKYIGGTYIPTTPPTTQTDNVTNSGSAAADNATTSADLSNTTSTSNGTTVATVDKTTADKIVDKAVENKSTEVVIDATANSTAAADSTTTAQVTIPTETLGAIAEKTEAIKNIEIKVSTKLDATKAGKKGIKVTWKTADGKKLDGVEFFRSVKKNSGYGKKAFFTSKKAGTTGYYLNTKSLKKGTRYYYRVRGYVLVDGQKVYTDWSNKGIRTFR